MSDVSLQKIAEDVRVIREELAALKEEINDLRDLELEVRPEYMERLKKIDTGEFKRFSSVEELRKEIEKD
jgi:prefoldin subunit 5